MKPEVIIVKRNNRLGNYTATATIGKKVIVFNDLVDQQEFRIPITDIGDFEKLVHEVLSRCKLRVSPEQWEACELAAKAIRAIEDAPPNVQAELEKMANDIDQPHNPWAATWIL